MKMDSTEKLAIIAGIAPVEIFRTDAGRFGALVPRVKIKDGPFLRSRVGFGNHPLEAVAALWNAMIMGRVIKDATRRDERREYAWNGRDWEIVRETGWAVVDGDGDLLSTIGFPSKRAALTDDTILVVWFDSEGDAGILANAIVAAGGEARAVRLDKNTLEEVAG